MKLHDLFWSVRPPLLSRSIKPCPDLYSLCLAALLALCLQPLGQTRRIFTLGKKQYILKMKRALLIWWFDDLPTLEVTIQFSFILKLQVLNSLLRPLQACSKERGWDDGGHLRVHRPPLQHCAAQEGLVHGHRWSGGSHDTCTIHHTTFNSWGAWSVNC